MACYVVRLCPCVSLLCSYVVGLCVMFLCALRDNIAACLVSLGCPLLGIMIPLLLELYFSVLIVVSSGRGFNDSGADSPGGHTPGGGRRTAAKIAGSCLSSRKIEKGLLARHLKQY